MSANVEIRFKLTGLAQAVSRLSAFKKQAAQDSERLAKLNELSATRSTNAYTRSAKARETLGIRSEHTIQREILRTEAAYNRLARSGMASSRELARAQAASVGRVRDLRKELIGADKDYSKLKLLSGAALAAGAYSTAMATKRAIEQGMSLDERLALRANAAYRGQSFEKRDAGVASMRGGIKSAVAGGMTVDEAMDTLDELIAKNQVGGVQNAIALLPKIAKFKAGQGSNPVEAASLVSTLLGSGFAKDQAQAIRQLDMISAAGGAGAFETDDLAKHLPSLLALAKGQGYVGDNGLKRVLVMLEQGMTTSGGADESANNLRNLFSKMNSDDTAKDFKRMGRGDLAQTMLNARAGGKTPDEVYLQVIEQETRNNPKLRAALKKAAMAKDDQEREERIAAVNELAKGHAIGKLFQDMQAKGAFLSLLNDAFGKEVAAAIDKSGGAVDKDAAYISERPGFKVRVATETGKLAQMDAVAGLSPLISKVADGFTELASKNPILVGAGTLAASMLTAVAAAAGMAALSMGGGKLAGLFGRGALGAATGWAARAGAGLLSSPFLAVANAGFIGYQAGGLINSGIDYGLDKFTGKDTSLGSELYDLFNKDNQPAQVETTVKVQLADGLKATSQTSNTSGPVKSWVSTGNVWGIP